MMRSKVGLSQMTAFWALSFTLPLLHFFFLAAPPLGAAAAAFALFAWIQEGVGKGTCEGKLVSAPLQKDGKVATVLLIRLGRRRREGEAR